MSYTMLMLTWRLLWSNISKTFLITLSRVRSFSSIIDDEHWLLSVGIFQDEIHFEGYGWTYKYRIQNWIGCNGVVSNTTYLERIIFHCPDYFSFCIDDGNYFGFVRSSKSWQVNHCDSWFNSICEIEWALNCIRWLPYVVSIPD